MSKVKVCGITKQQQIEALNELSVDYLGFIFYPKSKRFVTEKLSADNRNFTPVGVFVDASFDEIKQALATVSGIRTLQLHGNESPEFCAALKDYFTIIKAISVDTETDIISACKPYENSCHYFLFDTKTNQHGGSGVSFNWNKLAAYNLNTPFFLSGGIGIADTDKLEQFKHNSLYALDVNSRFETSPGIKDIDLISSFLEKIK